MAESALVVGGSGYVGSALVRELRARGIEVAFTYASGRERALALGAETGARPVALDLTADGAARALDEHSAGLTYLAHCAGVLGPASLDATTPAEARRVAAVGPDGALLAARAAAPGMVLRRRGSIVFVCALDRGQSLPLPPAFAAAQGALGALAMALAKELGAAGVRANTVSLGPLAGGLSASLPARLSADYEAFSALRRRGTAEEAARAIAWMLLDADYVTGRCLAANGGL